MTQAIYILFIKKTNMSGKKFCSSINLTDVYGHTYTN